MSVWSPLSQGLIPKNYAPGQLIYLQGTTADEFYYLLSGSARSYLSSEDGNERLLTVHRAGDLMGEASFFAECPRVSSAAAIEECQIVAVTKEQLNRVLQQEPQLAIPMLQYLARTVGLLSRHMDELSFRPAGQRIARYLLSAKEENGCVHCSHEEIGFATGLSRVTVSRNLSELSSMGLISTGYRLIRILDRSRLTEQAG